MVKDVKTRLLIKYTNVENGITEISIENLKSQDPDLKFSILDFIKIFTQTDTLPEISSRLNLWTNFSSKDFKSGDYKQKNDINDCSIFSRKEITSDFYGHFFFIRNIEAGTRAKIRLRTKFNRNNLKIRLQTSLNILEKHLKELPEYISKTVYIHNSSLLNKDLSNFNSTMRKAIEAQMSPLQKNSSIFYPYTVIDYLLSKDSYITDCVNYEIRKNKIDPSSISRNVYDLSRTSNSYLFDPNPVDNSFIIDKDFTDILKMEEYDGLED